MRGVTWCDTLLSPSHPVNQHIGYIASLLTAQTDGIIVFNLISSHSAHYNLEEMAAGS